MSQINFHLKPQMHQAAPGPIYKKMLVQLLDYFDLLVSYFCDKTVKNI